MKHGQEHEQVEALIMRWETSDASERSNAPHFLAELCDVLGVEHPNPADLDEPSILQPLVDLRPPPWKSEKVSPAIFCANMLISNTKRGDDGGPPRE